MQREKFARQVLRANGASDIIITPEEVDGTYRLVATPSVVTSDTGHLELFRIEPQHPRSPTFSGRWDLKANTLDIDLIGDASAKRAFQDGTFGYRGHHASILSDAPRIYQIHIRTSECCVFKGTVSVNIDLGAWLKDSFSLQESLEVLAAPVVR